MHKFNFARNTYLRMEEKEKDALQQHEDGAQNEAVQPNDETTSQPVDTPNGDEKNEENKKPLKQK
jgi:hypothetical protein